MIIKVSSSFFKFFQMFSKFCDKFNKFHIWVSQNFFRSHKYPTQNPTISFVCKASVHTIWYIVHYQENFPLFKMIFIQLKCKWRRKKISKEFSILIFNETLIQHFSIKKRLFYMPAWHKKKWRWKEGKFLQAEKEEKKLWQDSKSFSVFSLTYINDDYT